MANVLELASEAWIDVAAKAVSVPVVMVTVTLVEATQPYEAAEARVVVQESEPALSAQ